MNDRIKLDASLYLPERARELYIDHPEGLPDPRRNALIVGPMGSGKTMMLKALEGTWRTGEYEEYPVYVDLSHWISSIAGDTSTISSDGLSPRAQHIRSALELTIAYSLAAEIGVFRTPAQFPDTLRQFADGAEQSSPPAVRLQVKRDIREALMADKDIALTYPSPYLVASTLGREVRREFDRQIVLLVDQVDQVSGAFFVPIASLLRRSANHVAYVATRPCPTAPEREELPEDVVEGDAFSQFRLGRTVEGKIPGGFVGQVISELPIEATVSQELLERAQLLGELTWPSLRAAIDVAMRYVDERSAGRVRDEAWYEAVRYVAEDYASIANSTAASYCKNPQTLLRDWRDSTFNSRDGPVAPIGRSELTLSQVTLYEKEHASAGERLLRVLIKRGILLLADDSSYELGQLPGRCEVQPLLFLNDKRFDPSTFAAEPTSFEVTDKRLSAWAKSGGGGKSTKRLFVSFWMSDPKTEESQLAALLKQEFGGTVQVETGHIEGSKKWSTEIMKRIRRSDLLICDLTTPRRDVFVEYGAGIGGKCPVMQVTSDPAGAENLPQWCTSRQFQFYTKECLSRRLKTSVASALDTEPDLIERWIRDSTGQTIQAKTEIGHVSYVGPEPDEQLRQRIEAAVGERGFSIGCVVARRGEDNLESGIRVVRAAGVGIFVFDGSEADFLTAVLGGVFAAQHWGSFMSKKEKKRKRFQRRMYLLDLSGEHHHSTLIPGLLATHPNGEAAADEGDLLHRLRSRFGRLHGIIREARNG